MKVFSMNEYDWMAGESLESCITKYLSYYAGGEESDVALDEPHEVLADKMGRMKFHDEDGSVRTFREELDRLIAEGGRFPRFFASTEF